MEETEQRDLINDLLERVETELRQLLLNDDISESEKAQRLEEAYNQLEDLEYDN